MSTRVGALVVPGCTASPPSSSRLTAAFASQLLLPACRAITTPPPPRGPWSVCIRAVPSATFSLTASDVLHAWPRCSRADPLAARTARRRPARRCPAQLLLLLLLPDPRSPRPCRIALAHARTACVLGLRHVLLTPPMSDHHQVLHARALLSSYWSTPNCRAKAPPARPLMPPAWRCPHMLLHAPPAARGRLHCASTPAPARRRLAQRSLRSSARSPAPAELPATNLPAPRAHLQLARAAHIRPLRAGRSRPLALRLRSPGARAEPQPPAVALLARLR
jgi:hypothetical protein